MALPTRKNGRPADARPAAKPPVVAPTKGEVEVAADKLSELLGMDDDFAATLVEYCCKSAATARAIVEYSIFAVRCLVAEAKLSIPRHQGQRLAAAERPIRDHLNALKKARKADFDAKKVALGMDDKAEGKDEAVAAAKIRHLFDVRFGSKLPMTVPEREILVERLGPVFNPPEGTPLAEALYREIVGPGGWYLRMGDWLLRHFYDEAETAEYEEALQSARTQAQADAEAAEEAADAETETEATGTEG